MDFLLEVGVEDLPAGSIGSLREELSLRFSRFLTEFRITAEKTETFSTVRRLVITAKGLPEKQPDNLTEIPGPPATSVFQPDGSLTSAGEGYCRAHRIEPKELKVKEDGKKRSVYYLKKEAGKPVRECLLRIIPLLLTSLPFSITMRWGEGDLPFIRPVTSILALLDNTLLPVEFAGLKAQPFTYGHPTLSPKKIRVGSISGYFQNLSKNHVIINSELRKQKLLNEITPILPEGANFSKEKLTEISQTLEYPQSALSRLEIAGIPYPPEVVALIIENLRCLPLFGPDKKILPEFVIITDGQVTKEVKEGFHRVIESRLEDAKFFWQEDTRTSIPERLKTLNQVIFQVELGSLSDYSAKLTMITAQLGKRLNLNEAEIADLTLAGQTAKVDLTTSMVREFPETGGIIGANLLQLCGYSAAVTSAVREHPLPRFAGDRIPETILGQILSFSDRILHLAGLFAVGIQPSGSTDPYGLRRLAQTAIEVAWKANLRLSLSEITGVALGAWEKEDADIKKLFSAFLYQRMENTLESQGFRPDIVSAGLAGEGDSLTAYPARVSALSKLAHKTTGPASITTFSRVTNIIIQAKTKNISYGTFQPDILTEEAEKELWTAWNSRQAEIEKILDNEDVERALDKLGELEPVINRFFDKVLVMAPEENLRHNRLSLLATIDRALRRIGNLNRIQIG